MLAKVRDVLTFWKVKLTRASSYLTVINSLMLLYLFAQQIYGIPCIQEHFEFATFMAITYAAGVIGFVILAEFDWRYVFLKESGFITSKQPAMITECFRSAYLLHKAKQEGNDVRAVFKKLRNAFRISGYEEVFLEFWRMLEHGVENDKGMRGGTSR